MIKFGPRPLTSAAILASLSSQNIGGNSFTGNAAGYVGLSGRFFLRSTLDGEVSIRNAAETLAASLVVEANHALAQRNGINAQTLRLYNTYTDVSNYERLAARVNSGVFTFGPEWAGTGLGRPFWLAHGSTTVALEDSSSPGGASVGIYRNGTSASTIFSVGSTGLTNTAILHTRIMPSINQASGSYTILDINPTETAIGPGPHFLLRGRLGASADVFQVRNDGSIISGSVAGGGVQFKNSGGVSAVFTRADGTTPIGIVAGTYRMAQVTVSSLGSASGAGAGTLGFATDLTSTTRGATATGGGSLKGTVQSDGTNWLVV